ncbi:MAG: NUDIX hydrolase [Gemmataceae bacterium]
MNPPPPMNLSKPEPLTYHPWLNLFRVGWTRDKMRGDWIFASRRKVPKSWPVPADAVVIVPILREEGKPDKILILKEFRIPVGTWSYGLPAGLIEPGETAETTIRRELHEEAGLEVVTVLRLSPPLYSSCGLTDETFIQAFVLARHLPGGACPEASEAIVPMELDFEAVCRLLENPEHPFDAKCWLVLDSIQKRGSVV